ncbi:MAG: hypothetical protein QCI38_01580 [Candidatus Thermoplasmatota archaeon]|nr:hypothetical protein [Candidatus Thermoplasmatota archaeon]
MGNIEIDVPGKEEEIVEQPEEEGKAISIEIDEEETPPSKENDLEDMPRPPKKKGKGIFVVSLVLLLLLGGMVGFYLVQPTVTGVQIFKEKEDADSVTMRLNVNTGLMRTFDGQVNVRVIYNGANIVTLSSSLTNSAGTLTIEKEDFYVDNGEYTFEASIEGYTDSVKVELYQTAKFIYVSSPSGDWIPQVAINTVRSDSFGFKWMNLEDAAYYLDLQNIRGNGTLTLWNMNMYGGGYNASNISQLNDPNDDFSIASVDFNIGPTAQAATSIEVTGFQGCDSVVGSVSQGLHILDFRFTVAAYPRDAWLYFTVEFTNSMPSTPVLTIEGQSAPGWAGA